MSNHERLKEARNRMIFAGIMQGKLTERLRRPRGYVTLDGSRYADDVTVKVFELFGGPDIQFASYGHN